MTKEKLQEMRSWADEKLATGEEPPWAWYQYMKLRETLDAILAGQEATVEFNPEDKHTRLVSESDHKITLPM